MPSNGCGSEFGTVVTDSHRRPRPAGPGAGELSDGCEAAERAAGVPWMSMSPGEKLCEKALACTGSVSRFAPRTPSVDPLEQVQGDGAAHFRRRPVAGEIRQPRRQSASSGSSAASSPIANRLVAPRRVASVAMARIWGSWWRIPRFILGSGTFASSSSRLVRSRRLRSAARTGIPPRSAGGSKSAASSPSASRRNVFNQ